MKNFIYLFVIGCFVYTGYSQVGIGTLTPSQASMLEVSSSSDGGTTFKGLMPPRVQTMTDRDAINATATDAGLIVFVISTGSFDIWNGVSWDRSIILSVLPTEPWVNEIHYNNTGADTAEGIEIAGPTGMDLSGYRVLLYNGANGTTYGSFTLSGIIDNESNNFGALWFARANIQNGNPEGIALVKIATGAIIQFLSYGGSFTATAGTANGMTSTDILVFEQDTTPIGLSLQLTGTGNQYPDFNWAGPNAASPGNLNTGQTIN